MKKTIYFLFLILICHVRPAYGDENHSINLDTRDHRIKNVSLPFGNIVVELQSENEDDQYNVSVRLENTSQDYILCLFKRSFVEKVLRKTYNIVYEKGFGGNRGTRETKVCPILSNSNDVCKILQGNDSTIIELKDCESHITCTLPIYIACKSERGLFKKKRIILLEEHKINLEINVELKPDEDYIRLSNAVNSLIEEINSATFCSNKNHKGLSATKLKSKYRKRIEELNEELTQIIGSNSRKIKALHPINEKLNNIDLDSIKVVTSCINDKTNTHNCEYCKKSLGEISTKIEKHLVSLYNSTKSKEQIIGDVKALYNCAVKNKRRKRNQNIINKITECYNNIIKSK